LALGILEETWCCDIEGARFAENIAGVDHAKVFLGETAFETRVCVDCAEGETREGVFIFGDMGCGVAEGC